MNKNEKCIFLNYKNEFIFHFYNLIKKKIIRVNDMHFIEKRLYFINFKKEIKTQKLLNKH